MRNVRPRTGILNLVTPRHSRSKSSPVESRKPDPLVWAAALKEAKGDVRRLKLLDDGTALVVRNAES
ncbi:hypothetical protein N802_11555 [Knoellia sinensis KCTC 19936]|uniref:Uncharacterized protein n=1 Tax=Knoellia sinensis KCTC 19936 TaxID=1385520 RepID=A0A0A0IYZ3_9MICO|nr:hypothetical protein N802_11555 [Knoellia sinensis KCTC 19936]